MMITITFLNFYFARAFGRVYLMKKVEENAGIRVLHNIWERERWYHLQGLRKIRQGRRETWFENGVQGRPLRGVRGSSSSIEGPRNGLREALSGQRDL